jgi:short-subunit dehydrogenase
MRRQGGGRIVNISSIGGKIYEPLGGWYHATKFAVEGLSDSMRVELAPFGIQVVLILPGAIKTEWSGISASNVMATSGTTAYAEQARMMSNLLNATDNNPRLVSPPEVIAKAVARAVTARRPRTHYVVGGGAKPIIFARRVLPDRAFDRLIVAMYKGIGGRSAKRGTR